MQPFQTAFMVCRGQTIYNCLINKNNDYQEAMLIMYDGKLYPLNLFSQKSDQILDEYFSNNNRN